MKRALIYTIRLYQWLSRNILSKNPLLVPISGCRSWPTCSEYAIQAIETQGPIRGSGAALARVLRCNPLVSLTRNGN